MILVLQLELGMLTTETGTSRALSLLPNKPGDLVLSWENKQWKIVAYRYATDTPVNQPIIVISKSFFLMDLTFYF